MNNVLGPIFIRLGNRGRPFQDKMEKPAIGTLRNVSISNVQAIGADHTGCSIAGLPDHPIENVTLTNVRISSAGGGTRDQAKRQVPENPEAYPEYKMFGVLPAYGFYCRHVRNLMLDNVEVGVTAPDARPSLSCDDVNMMRVSTWNTVSPPANGPVLRFEDVRDALIHDCRGSPQSGPCLRVEGKNSRRIELLATDATQGAKGVEIGSDVPQAAVKINGVELKAKRARD
jgi:hypothetical protein